MSRQLRFLVRCCRYLLYSIRAVKPPPAHKSATITIDKKLKNNNMKTFLTTAIAILLFTITCRAQNTFPSSGSAGIGTTSPASTLQVVGDTRFGTNGTYTDLRMFTDGVVGGYNQINAISPVT